MELKTVLIIDDEPNMGILVTRLAAKRNILTLVARSGSHAINIVENLQTPISLALIDIKMSPVGGIEVLKVLKLLRPALPVIMMTGFFPEQFRKEVIKAGAMDCLGKPVDFPALLDSIEELPDSIESFVEGEAA